VYLLGISLLLDLSPDNIYYCHNQPKGISGTPLRFRSPRLPACPLPRVPARSSASGPDACSLPAPGKPFGRDSGCPPCPQHRDGGARSRRRGSVCSVQLGAGPSPSASPSRARCGGGRWGCSSPAPIALMGAQHPLPSHHMRPAAVGLRDGIAQLRSSRECRAGAFAVISCNLSQFIYHHFFFGGLWWQHELVFELF